MNRVIVVPYDPQWPALFAQAADELHRALDDTPVTIHHIGSTSVPGLCAKPIIDMLALTSDLSVIDSRTPQIQSLGYEAMGEFGIAGRRYFRRNNPAGVRTHQIHAFAADSPHVLRHLAFRDFLRAHPEIALQYGTLKQTLAAAHPNDIEAYMDGKDRFIKQLELRALHWRASRN